LEQLETSTSSSLEALAKEEDSANVEESKKDIIP
jgi:hypothetical protein